MNSRLLTLLSQSIILFTLLATLLGCGSPATQRSQEEGTVDRALQAAFAGERAEFVTLVAPSYLEGARAEMPDIDDATLGGILIAGFTEGIPFVQVVDASYTIEVAGDNAVAYVWGLFRDSSGEELELSEAEAVRIPLVREGGNWYLDLLDL